MFNVVTAGESMLKMSHKDTSQNVPTLSTSQEESSPQKYKTSISQEQVVEPIKAQPMFNLQRIATPLNPIFQPQTTMVLQAQAIVQ